MITAVDSLLVKLARGAVRVRGYTQMRNGHPVHVSAYTYVRRDIMQEGHRRGWSVESGSAFRSMRSQGRMLQVSPEKTEKGTLVRGSIKDANGKELMHISGPSATRVFDNIEQLARVYRSVGRFPRSRSRGRKDIAVGIRSGYPHRTASEVRRLIKEASR